MPETTDVRLARMEGKIDNIDDKQNTLLGRTKDQEKRLRSLEHHRSWLWGAWAAVLALFKYPFQN